MKNLIIGIDADVEKNGAAVYNNNDQKLQVYSLSFFELFVFLKEQKEKINVVKIEGGWLVKKSNFRKTRVKNISDVIARKVGENHATGKKIVEMCEFLEIPFKIVRPLLKRWKGPDGKITHEELEKILTNLNVELKTRTNQDKRDAILICLF